MYNIKIEADGRMKFIYQDNLKDLLQEGPSSIVRVSHVEPDIVGRWWADLSPVKGPKLGPFEYRGQALEAEVVWLKKHL